MALFWSGFRVKVRTWCLAVGLADPSANDPCQGWIRSLTLKVSRPVLPGRRVVENCNAESSNSDDVEGSETGCKPLRHDSSIPI